MTPKRVNFTKSEKCIFINIVHKYRSIIESKTTDAVTNKEKANCWEMISKEYNAVVECRRNGNQLKKLWNNEKLRARKEHKRRKLGLLEAGGLTEEGHVESQDHDSLILDIVGATASEIENQSDSDGPVIVAEQPETVDDKAWTRGHETPHVIDIVELPVTCTYSPISTPLPSPHLNKKEKDELTVARIKATNAAAELAAKEVKMKEQQHLLDIEIKKETLLKIKLEQQWLTENMLTAKVKRRKLELECKAMESGSKI